METGTVWQGGERERREKINCMNIYEYFIGGIV